MTRTISTEPPEHADDPVRSGGRGAVLIDDHERAFVHDLLPTWATS